MNEIQVTELMKSSMNNREWNANCDVVKQACGGYPPFWYGAIVMSGLLDEVRATWLESYARDSGITITRL